MDSSEHRDWVTAPELAKALGMKGGRLRDKLAKGQFAGAYQDEDSRWHIPARFMPTFENVSLFDFEAH